jgi:hypothetical protein
MSTKASSGNNIDAKREEFRKYLEKEGVLEYLTKQLVKLMEEADKPSNALDYLKNNFTGKDPEDSKLKVENLEKENEQLKEKIKLLESEKNDLKLKLKELESASASDGSLAPAQQTAETKESDEDDAMETGEDKDETKSPSKSVETAALSPEPSKFDEPRSPVLSDKKEDATESSSKVDDISSNDKMDSDESKEKPEGDENSMTTGGKGMEDGSLDTSKTE